jgi:hypothetical protein
MGNVCQRKTEEDIISEDIDYEIKVDAAELYATDMKILFLGLNLTNKINTNVAKLTVVVTCLGTGEAGKSTIWKQIKLVHDNGFSEREFKDKQKAVYTDLVTCMFKVLENESIPGLETQLKRIEDIEPTKLKGLTFEQRQAIVTIVKNPAFAAAFQRKRFSISDSAPQ